MCAFLWRIFNTHNNEVAAGSFWDYVGSSKMAFLPSVWLFGQLSVRVINVNGNLCLIDLCSQPEPVFIALEQLLPHCLFFSRTEVAAPVVLTHLKSLFHIRFGRLKSKRLRVIHRCEKPR